MSKKPNLSSDESSSPEESNFYYLNAQQQQQQYFRNNTEQRGTDKTWKPYFSNSDMPASAIFTHIETPEEGNMANHSVSFLYDYYGMTEETRQDPPSPGHSSPVSSVDEKEHRGIDIPQRQTVGSPVLEISHSFPESGRTSIASDISVGDEPVSLTKKTHSASVPSINKERSASYSGQTSSPTGSTGSLQNVRSLHPEFPKGMFGANERYVFVLHAQTSIVQKRGEDSLTYLNKGQFYNLTFEAKSQACKLKTVKSIIHLVFRDEKDPTSELAHWKYWYNQQPNPNQRAFDIDRKACHNIDDIIEEVGCNALGFTWDPSEQAKVSLRINCLSTDFSPQKGVRGIPLHIQIDSYEDFSPHALPVHRAFCQIKVFRDKGAERKNKDESKTVSKRMFKYMKQGSETNHVDMANVFQLGNKVTVLHPATPLGPKSVIFVPNENGVITSSSASLKTSSALSPGSFLHQLKERESKRGFNTALSNAKEDFENLDVYPKFKLPRVVRRHEPAVTIYVRKEEEKAYNALMLETFTLNELKLALAKKYSIPVEMIKSIFKKTKKGILVNMDDQLVEQFVDEDDFLVSIEFDNQLGQFEVILSC